MFIFSHRCKALLGTVWLLQSWSAHPFQAVCGQLLPPSLCFLQSLSWGVSCTVSENFCVFCQVLEGQMVNLDSMSPSLVERQLW